MKSISSPRKMWALIGAAGTVAIVALGWVLLISGEKSRKTDLESQIANAQVQTAMDQHKIAQLRADNEKLPVYKTQLAALRTALPLTSATPQFATSMQRLGVLCHVNVTAVNSTPPAAAPVTVPVPADAGGTSSDSTSGSSTTTSGTGTTGTTGATGATAAPAATELAVTVAASGSIGNLQHFLAVIQHSEPRALVVTQATQTDPVGGSGGSAGVPTLSLTMKAFIGAS
jgi:hypothetical protein